MKKQTTNICLVLVVFIKNKLKQLNINIMINIILIKTPNGDAIINIDEISSIKPENLSFKKCTIELKNKSHVDCIETTLTIYNKITNI